MTSAVVTSAVVTSAVVTSAVVTSAVVTSAVVTPAVSSSHMPEGCTGKPGAANQAHEAFLILVFCCLVVAFIL